jgi:shikimate dehydrogenase
MQLFGLIGYPLSHSFSAKYFAKKFEAESISDTDYQLFPLENISEVTSLIKLYPDLLGFNITIPYKVAILPFLDDITTSAKSVGAVNCVKVERDASGVKLTGHNTDIYGFRESLVPFLKPFHSNALVLGTGGAAKAVCYTLNELGIHYTLVSRSGKENSILEYYQLTNKIISDNHLIINTSPVGTFPDTDKCPDIPYQFLTNKHLLFDLIYNPVETKFLRMGREAGAAILNGSKMLELQAEKSWEIWNG